MAGKTILIVEDNEVQREGLAVVLRKEGYSVLPTTDAGKALATLNRTEAPDLILLDMLMPPPATDGWRFMAARKKNPALAAIPVLIMTAMGIASEEWAESLGACGLLRKPVDAEPLLAAVRHCTEEKKNSLSHASNAELKTLRMVDWRKRTAAGPRLPSPRL